MPHGTIMAWVRGSARQKWCPSQIFFSLVRRQMHELSLSPHTLKSTNTMCFCQVMKLFNRSDIPACSTVFQSDRQTNGQKQLLNPACAYACRVTSRVIQLVVNNFSSTKLALHFNTSLVQIDHSPEPLCHVKLVQSLRAKVP